MSRDRMRLGLAIEQHTSQFAELGEQVDFLEYGLQAHDEIPSWVWEMKSKIADSMVLHPLDVNLGAAGMEPNESWLNAIRTQVACTRATALVTDAYFWWFGQRSHTWPRTTRLNKTARACRYAASRISKVCGIPFRIENPPIDWLPDKTDIWTFLKEASDTEGVEICLDLSHLLQFACNASDSAVALPATFPWERVTEIHIAGYLEIEYRGRRIRLDDHRSPVSSDQISLFRNFLDRRGDVDSLDVCLEMEGRQPRAYLDLAAQLRTIVSTQ